MAENGAQGGGFSGFSFTSDSSSSKGSGRRYSLSGYWNGWDSFCSSPAVAESFACGLRSLNEPSAFGCGVGPSPKHHGFRCFSLLTWCFECASDEASDLDAFRTLSDGRQSSVADCGAGCELEVSNRVWLSFGAGREELAASRASGELGLHFSGICRPLGAYSSLDFGLRRMVPTSAERGHCLGDPQKSAFTAVRKSKEGFSLEPRLGQVGRKRFARLRRS